MFCTNSVKIKLKWVEKERDFERRLAKEPLNVDTIGQGGFPIRLVSSDMFSTHIYMSMQRNITAQVFDQSEGVWWNPFKSERE